MKDGDQNTSYFHSSALQRFKWNLVKGLRNSIGDWCEGDDQLVGLFVEYYKNLFSSSNPIQMEAVLKATPQDVIAKMNESLLGEFSKLEVDLALKQMSTLKALGPNRMLPIFY